MSLSEEDKAAYATAIADAYARSEQSHRFAERWIPILNVVAYSSLFIAIIGGLIHLFQG
jgi:hypothetical protein